MITNSDGDTRVSQHSAEEIQSLLNEEDAPGWLTNAMTEITDPDTNYWGGKVLIIKGEIVTPKPIEHIVSWELK